MSKYDHPLHSTEEHTRISKAFKEFSLEKILNEADAIVIRSEDRDTEGRLLSRPDGPPSHLNETQWKIVRTDRFKAWFGDWQTATTDISQIVDENGEPLFVYHETSKDFDRFNDAKIGSSNDTGYYGSGHYFASNEGISGFYSGREQIIFRGFLNIRRPYYFNDSDPDALLNRYLLNRRPKEVALTEAIQALALEQSRQALKKLEEGNIQMHRDIPPDAIFEIYWEEQRKRRIAELRQLIERHEQIVAELPQLYEVLNEAYDGVIVLPAGQQLSPERRTEIVAFRASQIAITEKYDHRSSW